MEDLKQLLKKYIIYKEDKKELYYSIKDNLKNFKPFITEKLGYNVFIRSDFIRLEKMPGIAERWMGIEEFTSPREYVMLMLLLVFLEDKGKEEQFLLSHITEAISGNDIGEKFHWTEYPTRRSLIKVLRFVVANNLITITDGNEENFATDTDNEVLFESTGVSKYSVRNFNYDILEIEDKNILTQDNVNLGDADKGVLRKNRVYRRLLLSPIIYREDSVEDYEYIKNYRKYIEDDFLKYLSWNLHVHKNGALLVPEDKELGLITFPNGKAVSDVVLLVLKEIISKIGDKELSLNEEDITYINKIDFEQLIIKVKVEKGAGWTKEYREMSDGKLFYEVIKAMEDFSFIKEEKEIIKILPLCGKVSGDYPKDYMMEAMDEK